MISKPFTKICYIAPVDAQAKKFWRSFIKAPALQPYIIGRRAKPFYEVEIINGSSLECRNFQHPDNIRGDGYTTVAADEAATISPDLFWDTVDALNAVQNGQLILSGTFKGEANWFTKEFEKGNGKDTWYKSFHWPSTIAPWFQTPEGKARLERKRQSLAGPVYNQEYLAIPAANLAGAFEEADLLACTKKEIFLPNINSCVYCAGVDVGYNTDGTGIVVIEFPTMRIVEAYKLEMKQAYSKQAQDIAKNLIKYRRIHTYVDVTGNANPGRVMDFKVYEQFKNEFNKLSVPVEPFYWNSNKERIYQNLQVAVQNHTLFISSSQDKLLSEMRTLECKNTNRGFEFEHQTGAHDDLPAALACALEGINRKKYPPMKPVNLNSMLY